MSDGLSDRLTLLRARWQADRSSRIFLQLAEEYRHLGRVQDALEVLNAGLEEHPGYLSALVAKGRCLLELGDAEGARPVLERVVQQDPTQMVANKLLVRACLETGEPEQARQRLELYSLLNDSDPEIEELERRVEAMSRPSQAPDGPRLEEPVERPHMDPSAAPGSNDATPGAPPAPPPPQPPESVSAGASADVFDLGAGAAPPARKDGNGGSGGNDGTDGNDGEDLFGLAALPPAVAIEAPGSTGGAAAPPARGEGNGAEPFPDLAPDHSRSLYLAHLESEQLFFFAPPAAAEAPAGTAASPAEAPAEAAPVTAAAPSAAASAASAPVAAAPAAPPQPEEAATEAPAAPSTSATPATPATITLGELYLRQGHVEEAEHIFRQVLDREPGNAAALQAIEALERSARMGRGRAAGSSLDAAQLLAGGDPGASATARKAYILQGYLTRLRQPRSPHVP